VAIVNQKFAARFFAGASPIGKQYQVVDVTGTLGAPVTIVGMVANTKYSTLREDAAPVAYIANAQQPDGFALTTLVIQVNGAPSSAMAAVQAAARQVDPTASLSFSMLDDQIGRSLPRDRVLATLSGTFASVALLLAMVGLYGVLAYNVARRRVEIGIRIALGAASGQVTRMVLGDVGKLVAAGVIVGGIAATMLAPVLRTFLYGTEPTDPSTFALAIVALGSAAVRAGLIPARRAAALQPTEALRQD
jgi:putative ABC transport system permease protein